MKETKYNYHISNFVSTLCSTAMYMDHHLCLCCCICIDSSIFSLFWLCWCSDNLKSSMVNAWFVNAVLCNRTVILFLMHFKCSFALTFISLLVCHQCRHCRTQSTLLDIQCILYTRLFGVLLLTLPVSIMLF